jgi:uncharacterized nucleotidyltransferase DUF6036
MSPDLPSPWAEFIRELDTLLDEPFELHCIGGFAAVVAYGLPRSTNDLDYFSLIPFNRVPDLDKIAGEGSALARKHKVYVHHAAVASVPENYEERMTELFPGGFKKIRLFVLDPYDIVLSKLSRNIERDREDVDYIAKTRKLDSRVLRERYEKELRAVLIGPVDRHDATLEFWIEAYFSVGSPSNMKVEHLGEV